MIGYLLALLLFMTGCATNPYSKFYTDNTAGMNIEKSGKFIIPTEPPVILKGDDIQGDGIRMLEDGYALLGFSYFNAGSADDDYAIEHAKQVHAAAVILYSHFTHTKSGALPLSVPNTQTSTTQLSIGNYSGTANTTTHGRQTIMMPYSVDKYDYAATYWIRRNAIQFGAVIKPLTDEQRQKLQSNKGLQIIAVVKNTPAFFADILRGDILRSIGERDTYDFDTFEDAIRESQGKSVKVVIYRNGQELTKDVKLKDSNPE